MLWATLRVPPERSGTGCAEIGSATWEDRHSQSIADDVVEQWPSFTHGFLIITDIRLLRFFIVVVVSGFGRKTFLL